MKRSWIVPGSLSPRAVAITSISTQIQKVSVKMRYSPLLQRIISAPYLACVITLVPPVLNVKSLEDSASARRTSLEDSVPPASLVFTGSPNANHVTVLALLTVNLKLVSFQISFT